jgi:hypothetical protein
VDRKSYDQFLKKYGKWDTFHKDYDFYASEAGLVRYAFAGSRVEVDDPVGAPAKLSKAHLVKKSLEKPDVYQSDIKHLCGSQRVQQIVNGITELNESPQLTERLEDFTKKNPSAAAVDTSKLGDFRFEPAIKIRSLGDAGGDNGYQISPINRDRRDNTTSEDIEYQLFIPKNSITGYVGKGMTHDSGVFTNAVDLSGGADIEILDQYAEFFKFLHKAKQQEQTRSKAAEQATGGKGTLAEEVEEAAGAS